MYHIEVTVNSRRWKKYMLWKIFILKSLLFLFSTFGRRLDRTRWNIYVVEITRTEVPQKPLQFNQFCSTTHDLSLFLLWFSLDRREEKMYKIWFQVRMWLVEANTDSCLCFVFMFDRLGKKWKELEGSRYLTFKHIQSAIGKFVGNLICLVTPLHKHSDSDFGIWRRWNHWTRELIFEQRFQMTLHLKYHKVKCLLRIVWNPLFAVNEVWFDIFIIPSSLCHFSSNFFSLFFISHKIAFLLIEFTQIPLLIISSNSKPIQNSFQLEICSHSLILFEIFFMASLCVKGSEVVWASLGNFTKVSCVQSIHESRFKIQVEAKVRIKEEVASSWKVHKS